MASLIDGLCRGICFLCLFLAAGVLFTGVTLRDLDETGSRLAPADRRPRDCLTVVAALLAGAALAWGVARAGEARRWGKVWRGLAGGLAVQELLFVGAAGILVGVVIGVGALRAEQPVAAEYRWVGVGSVAAAAVSLTLAG